MRRGEELKRWLQERMHNAGILSGLGNTFARELRAGLKAGGIKAEPLAIRADACCLDHAISASATVRDGLASMENPKSSMSGVEGFGQTGKAAREAALLGATRVCGLELPGDRHARVQERGLSLEAHTCSPGLSLKSSRTRTVDVLWDRAHRARDGDRLLMQNAVVPLPRYKIALLPHARKGIGAEMLSEAERASFLREAEALKGISADRAELLVVFRHVPIEVVSRMRFVAEKRALLYSIVAPSGPRRTRVHDMAVVRDMESREVHLIAHRTRFCGVFLN